MFNFLNVIDIRIS